MPHDGPSEETLATVRAWLAAHQERYEALPWHKKVRLRFASWRGELFWKAPVYDDETLAQFPSLATSEREWDALPRREKWRQRLASSSESGIVHDMGKVWLWLAMAGLGMFFVGGLVIKFVVPGGGAWLHEHFDTFATICFAPIMLALLVGLLYLAAGWVALPFILAIALWRRVRR